MVNGQPLSEKLVLLLHEGIERIELLLFRSFLPIVPPLVDLESLDAEPLTELSRSLSGPLSVALIFCLQSRRVVRIEELAAPLDRPGDLNRRGGQLLHSGALLWYQGGSAYLVLIRRSRCGGVRLFQLLNWLLRHSLHV